MSDADLRPLPQPEEGTAGFWEGCRRRELLLQHCADCAKPRFPPRPMCPACQSMKFEWRRLSGRGTVFSFVICHGPVLPAFASKVPFPILLVQVEEDPTIRMIGDVIGPWEGKLRIGAPVEVEFEDVAADVTLPQWRLTG
jgi:uncharacterized OB-fold protein